MPGHGGSGVTLNADEQREILAHLKEFVSDRRQQRMEDVLDERTRWLTVVLEDIYQPHNASAVLRSCECFGVQDVHIIENRNEYNLNPGVDMGASHWLTLHRYRDERANNSEAALDALKKRGYQLFATTPHRDDLLLEEVPVDRPLAVMLGTEESGLSDRALAAADAYVRIPMYGFTESFNISVCAALLLRELSSKMRGEDVPWALDKAEREALLLEWYRHSIRGVELLEQRYWEERTDS